MLCRHAVRHRQDAWPGRAYQLVKDATDMTQRLGALQALVDARSPLADAAIAHFHATFRGEALAIDKWFAVQARATTSISSRNWPGMRPCSRCCSTRYCVRLTLRLMIPPGLG